MATATTRLGASVKAWIRASALLCTGERGLGLGTGVGVSFGGAAIGAMLVGGNGEAGMGVTSRLGTGVAGEEVRREQPPSAIPITTGTARRSPSRRNL